MELLRKQVLLLWDVDHTLIENSGVSKAVYARAFEMMTGRAAEVQPSTMAVPITRSCAISSRRTARRSRRKTKPHIGLF